jgi:thioredoxin reductase (NADPH)
MSTRNVIIIGSGPAGLTAALYAARANLKPLLIEGLEAGGQLMLTTLVENWPGFRDGIMGPDLMAEMRAQSERFGAEIIRGNVTSVDLLSYPYVVKTSDGVHHCRALIIATGASARLLGLPSERALLGHGVSTCATCDGYFFRGKPIAVVGGGDSAMEEAIFLTKFADKVIVVHRRQEFRASPIMFDRARNNEKISFEVPYVVDEILDDDGRVSRALLRNLETDETKAVSAQGVFVAIGHDPNTELFLDQLDHDEDGYLVTQPGSTATNVPGVFAAGDVVDHVYRQAITAAGMGTMAALDAERWLAARHGHPEGALAALR